MDTNIIKKIRIKNRKIKTRINGYKSLKQIQELMETNIIK